MRDPSVYIILSLNSNLEVIYSTVHLFNYQGEICNTRVMHGDQERVPFDELDRCLAWGAAALNDFFTDLYASPSA
jgi:hypothetical protein